MDTLTDNTLHSALSKEELLKQLEHLGVKNNMILEVHASLKSVGYVIGGASSFVDALRETLSEGTLVMASQNIGNSEPLGWHEPPIEMRFADKVRDNMPGYDIYHSDIHTMGALALNLRSRKSTYHSYHPNCAFMASGQDARELMKAQPLNFPFGYGSPLDKMYHNDNSYILLIGVGYERATGLHYAESISEVRPIVLQGGAVKKDGKDVWKKFMDYDLDCQDFVYLGKAMERKKLVHVGKIGQAQAHLFNFRQATDFAIDYFKERFGDK